MVPALPHSREITVPPSAARKNKGCLSLRENGGPRAARVARPQPSPTSAEGMPERVSPVFADCGVGSKLVTPHG